VSQLTWIDVDEEKVKVEELTVEELDVEREILEVITSICIDLKFNIRVFRYVQLNTSISKFDLCEYSRLCNQIYFALF